MSIEENKAIVRRFFEIWNTKNVALLDELSTPDGPHHMNGPINFRGTEAGKKAFEFNFKAMPDLVMILEAVVAEGDTVVIRWKRSGTHTGEISVPQLTLPPSGKRYEDEGVTVYRLENGRIAEVWDFADVWWRQLAMAKP